MAVVAQTSISISTGIIMLVITVAVYAGGIITSWVTMKTKIEQLRTDFSTLLQRHIACSEKQQGRYEGIKNDIHLACDEMKTLHNQISIQVNNVAQKLEDLIKWAMNGRREHG